MTWTLMLPQVHMKAVEWHGFELDEEVVQIQQIQTGRVFLHPNMSKGLFPLMKDCSGLPVPALTDNRAEQKLFSGQVTKYFVAYLQEKELHLVNL